MPHRPVVDDDGTRNAACQHLALVVYVGSFIKSLRMAGDRCEPGTKRVAPLSSRKSSTMKMKPTIGHPSASDLKSTCRGCACECGRNVRASIELSLKGRPITTARRKNRVVHIFCK